MILIVGKRCYVGRYLSIDLKEQGYDVLALGRSKRVQQFFIQNGVNFQEFDINDEKLIEALPTKNVEAVVSLVACLELSIIITSNTKVA